MKNRKVIASRNLPSRLPLWPTLTLWLFLDRIAAPVGVYYAVFIFLAIVWLASIANMSTQQQVDLFNDEPEEKKTWKERVEELKNKQYGNN